MNFTQKLQQQIKAKGTAVCVGIDPHLHVLPPFFEHFAEKTSRLQLVEEFSRSLINGCKDLVPAVKFQSSFFEALGWQGFKLLQEQIAYAKEQGLLVILDAKRGDISSTMDGYGRMAFDEMKADCLTITPYMGRDVIKPLLPWLESGSGIYIVWVTSNPSGTDLQECDTHQGIVAEVFLDLLLKSYTSEQLGGMGLVLGATKLQTINFSLIEKASRLPLLLPGVGAQGGEITDTFKKLMQTNKHLIPVSRGVAGLGHDKMKARLDQISSWGDYRGFVKENCQQFIKDISF